jgi:ferric-dicitrate binding protein FerR (iron transport regulator)
VRGTKWLVQDTCTTTTTTVKRGKVAVRDFVKRKTVLVKAGKKYVARRR